MFEIITENSEEPLLPNLVGRVFGGVLKTMFKCAQCKTDFFKFDTFQDLQLCFPQEIEEGRLVSVQNSINNHLKRESLTGNNKYIIVRIEKCEDKCDAKTKTEIADPPSHLILTLKHFHYDQKQKEFRKLKHTCNVQ